MTVCANGLTPISKFSVLTLFYNFTFHNFLKHSKERLLKKIFYIFFFKKRKRARFKIRPNLVSLFSTITVKSFTNKRRFKKRRLKRRRFKMRRIRYFKKNSSMFFRAMFYTPATNMRLFCLSFLVYFLHFTTLRSFIHSSFSVTVFSRAIQHTPLSNKKVFRGGRESGLLSLRLGILNALTLFNNSYWFTILHFLPFSIAFKFLKKNTKKRRIFSMHVKSSNLVPSTDTFFYRNFYICTILFRKIRCNNLFSLRCSHFYSKYVLKYLEFYFKSKVSISFLPYCFYKKKCKRVRRALNVCLFPVLKNFNRLFFFNDFISVLSITFLQRNISIFVRWLMRFMKKIRIKLHKRFLFLLRLYFTRLFKLYSKGLKYKGFKLQIKGKISVAGSSKKRIFKMSQGLCSLTTKNSRVSYYNNIIRTYTGALGIKAFLFY